MIRPPSRVYTCLTEPLIIGGVEPLLGAMNVIVGLGMFIMIKSLWLLLGIFVVHLILRTLCKRDPFLRVIYSLYWLQADRYAAWPERKPTRGLRPRLFGRGLL